MKSVYQASSADFDAHLNNLRFLRILPRLSDLWDIIPFSFCIDWFVPIGDLINHTDLEDIRQTMPFKYMIVTRKITNTTKMSFTINSHEFTVDVKSVSYNREVLDEYPKDVWLGLKFRDPRKQAITGGALVIGMFCK